MFCAMRGPRESVYIVKWYFLRKMDGASCPRWALPQDMTTARMKDAWLTQICDFAQTFVFLGRGQHFAPELKKRIKSVIDDQELILASKNWGFQILKKSWKQSKNQALAQKAKRALCQVNGIFLKAQRGAFWKSIRLKIKNIPFFESKKHFLKNVICQCPYFMCQRQIIRGAINCISKINIESWVSPRQGWHFGRSKY